MKNENNFLALMILIFGLPFLLISLLFGYEITVTVKESKVIKKITENNLI